MMMKRNRTKMTKSLTALTMIGLITVATSVIPAKAAVLPTIKLRVTYQLNKDSARVVKTIKCSPNGGTYKYPARICRQLRSAGLAALKPTPPDTACSMIYGSDKKATVVGRWGNRVINAKFSQVNGCEIDRWQKLGFLLDN
mgnify:CR=1 FL=1